MAAPENLVRVPDKTGVFLPEELGLVGSRERFSFPRQRANATLIVERGCCSSAVALHGVMARCVTSPRSLEIGPS